ncbi:hypothetical protein BZA70DRAFT_85187 [Myxozyma melibiosi]|uniref:Outer kinetochore protein SPC19 n=1 Tax=Myxozyma melibiosi TaxID=54550 RepID=A0ABR1F0D1_9ASCO
MDLQIQDPLLCDSLALISSIRDLSSRAFELLGELSHASQAAAAALPSPEADVHDEQGENEEVKKEVKEEEGQETQMEVDASMTPPPPADPHTHALECEFASLYKPLLAKTIRTRQVSRAHLLALQNAKGKIAQRREEVDRLQLELQNSYYRQRYLKKEIELCMDFRSSHLDIDFVPIEEFLTDHPEYTMSSDSSTAAQSDIEMEDSTPETPAATEDPPTTTTTPSPPTATAPRALSEHELIIARLEDERARRLLLEERKKALIARKSDLTKENSKRKNDLENLDAQLSRFIESATPIQKVLEK